MREDSDWFWVVFFVVLATALVELALIGLMMTLAY